jgi:type I restriction enzyme S subunit
MEYEAFEGTVEVSKWPLVKLADVAEQCLGKMLDAKKNKGRPMPYLRNPNVRWFEVDTTDLQLMPFEDHEQDRFGLKAGDIVMCEGGEAGRAAIWDGRMPDLKFQKAIHRIRPGKTLFNRYFVHRLYSDYQSGRLADYYTGATIKHLTGQDLKRYEFPLPPLAEQRRIAGILDRADELRAKRRAALAQLDELTQAIFLDMFGDPAANPSGFQKKPLASLVRDDDTINYGVVQPGDDLDEGVPLVRVGDLIEGKVRHSDLKRIAPSIEAAYKRSRLRGDELLVSCVGSVGVVALADLSVKGFNIARAVVRIPLAETTCRLFMAAYLNTEFVQRYFTNELRTVSQPTLNIKQLSETIVVLPPIEQQHEFARRVTAVETLKTAHRASLAELDALFASLQHRAFRGEL